MSNCVSLAQLIKMERHEVDALPLDLIEMLLEDVTELKAHHAACHKILSDALHARFHDVASINRRKQGKQVGTVTFEDSGYKVKADLPKKVEWDQAQLRHIVEDTITASWAENPRDYVSIKYEVSEAKYNAWPSSIQKVFEPARTLGVGTPSYKIEVLPITERHSIHGI